MIMFGIASGDALIKKTDYTRLIEEFGAKPIRDELIKYFKKPHIFILLRHFYAHRDLDIYLKRHKDGEDVAIVTGRGPSNYMHIGHLALFKFVKWLQDELNAYVYIPLSDDEKYVFGKVPTLNDAYAYAIDNALDIIALGFSEKKTKLFISTKTSEIYELSVRISRYLTYNTVRATFGLEDITNVGILFYAAVQAAHILLPTVLKGLPVLVPIGIDQDPYMRLTRDVAEELKVIKPAAIYSRYVRGLTGEPMSASKPETSVFTVDSSMEIKKKVWNALTGGQPTVKEQRKLGGNPDKCVVYEWLKLFVYNDLKKIEEHHRSCKAGELICGECKRILIDALIKMLDEHRRRKREAIKRIDKYFIHEVSIPDGLHIP